MSAALLELVLLSTMLLVVSLLCTTVYAARAPSIVDEWMRLEDYPVPVLESGGGMLRDADGNRHLVVAGGYVMGTNLRTTNVTYSLPLQSDGPWRAQKDMPMHLTHVAQAIFGERLYTAGGFLGQAPGSTVASCFVFHLPSNKWSSLPSLPAPRAGGGLVYNSQQNSLLFSAGTQRDTGRYWGVDKADTWILFLDNTSAGWFRRQSIANPRNHMSAVSVGGRYFFLGGQHSGDETNGNQATVQEYNFSRDEWISRRSLPMPVGHIAASTLAYWNGIIVVGGIKNGRTLSNQILYYDALVDEWKFVGSYPRMVQSPVCGLAFRRLYCATGAGTGTAKSGWMNVLSIPIEV